MPAEVPLRIAAHVPECLFAVGLSGVALSELRDRRLPNSLLMALAMCGLAARLPDGITGVGLGAAGLVVGIGVLLPLFAHGLLGGGDVKLLGAIGAWVGPVSTLHVALVGFALGGLLSVAIALSHRELRRDVTTNLILAAAGAVPAVEARPLHRTVPLGAAFAAAVLIVFFWRGGLQ
jgi:prepilin peptidase CpaA